MHAAYLILLPKQRTVAPMRQARARATVRERTADSGRHWSADRARGLVGSGHLVSHRLLGTKWNFGGAASAIATVGAVALLMSALAQSASGRAQMAQTLHGILVLDCLSPVRILDYSVGGGQAQTVATFPVGYCDSNLTVSGGLPSPLLAQQFSSDFRRMAVTFASPNGNGNQHIGYVTRGGQRVDLTPVGKEKADSSGFGGPPCTNCNIEYFPRFQPHTSWLYFERTRPFGLMRVNVDSGIRSRATAHYTRQPSSGYTSTHVAPDGADFSPNGNVVLALAATDPSEISPTEVYLLNSSGNRALSNITPPGGDPCPSVRTLAQLWPAEVRNYCDPGGLVNNSHSRHFCTANSWAGPDAVLCSDVSRIYVISGVQHSASARSLPLTPDVGRQNRDPVASPDGSRFAFISNVPSTNTSPASGDQLWVGSTGGGHLHELGTVPTGADIIGWR
jgi:hypothetical protein